MDALVTCHSMDSKGPVSITKGKVEGIMRQPEVEGKIRDPVSNTSGIRDSTAR
ncbi:hypothetical protein RND71_036811 [Anisodus tanguticus]|uniref:Uncharacterized protein n=1 Tax=Anisodus tanguticus TaxID=243964 RepID=A0AAE1UUH8_9SOLA|nr:hypothetical protein RND71_036811 [Anisodus tanguticus]